MLNNKVMHRWGVRDVVNKAMMWELLEDMHIIGFLLINKTSRVYTCIIIYIV